MGVRVGLIEFVCVFIERGMGVHTDHHHHHSTTTTCHGAARMENTMKDLIVHFDWMDFIRGGRSRRGVGRQQSREV